MAGGPVHAHTRPFSRRARAVLHDVDPAELGVARHAEGAAELEELEHGAHEHHDPRRHAHARERLHGQLLPACATNDGESITIRIVTEQVVGRDLAYLVIPRG